MKKSKFLLDLSGRPYEHKIPTKKANGVSIDRDAHALFIRADRKSPPDMDKGRSIKSDRITEHRIIKQPV